MSMNQVSSTRGVSSTPQPEAPYTRLHGAWLVLARVMWLALVAFVLGFFIVSLPRYVAYLYTVSPTLSPNSWQLSSASAQALQQLGISLDVYAPFAIAFSIAIVMVWVVVGVVIFWRRSDDWMALLAAFALIAWGTGTITIPFHPTHFAGQFALQWLEFFRNAPLTLYFFLFPSGRFVPRWTRWYAMVVIALAGATYFFPHSPLNYENWPSPLNFLALLSAYFILVGAQMYRYRRVSTVREREQTKWVVFALAIALLSVAEDIAVEGVLNLDLHILLAQFLYQITWNLVLVLIPLSIGIAILRSRLYDIDIIINRTLVYGTLTVILTGVYVGLVIGLQALLRGIISQDSSVAIVISTLAIAALFQPLRHRLQQLIDRRFYRSKYDASKIIEAFSATLRQEVDLDQLREQLLAVVQETMQPAHVSLWLRPPERHTQGLHRLQKPHTLEERS
jgi:hypothetical protein